MVDTKRLKEEILDYRINIETMAKRMGMDRATLYRKLKGEVSEFTVSEADRIIKELELSPKELMDIFFKDQSHISN